MTQSQLRVARIDGSGLTPPDASPEALRHRHARLQQVIRRHLPGITASILAQPRPVPDSPRIDWYSDLAGQPTPLPSLPPDEQAAARSLLADRLASINRLADELPALAPEDADVADSLRQAITYPDETYVYVVDGAPVLTFWGYRSGKAATPVASPSGPAGRAAGGPARSGRSPLPWLALLFLLAAAAAGGWLWLDHQREQGLLAAMQEAMTAECNPIEPLSALKASLAELDPDGSRYPDLQRQAAAETERCTRAQQLAQDMDLASGDCERLAVLADRLEGQEGIDLTRQPHRDLYAELTSRRSTCDRAQIFSARLDAAIGDCQAVAALDEELGTAPGDATALLALRERLDGEVALCARAAQLLQDLDTNLGNCPELLRIDGRITGLDTSRPPLSAVRARLEPELDLCAKADRYSRALAEAQTDCEALRKLDAEMQSEDSSAAPLATVRKRLDKALEACKSLDDLEQALQDALGDCTRLSALDRRLDEEAGLKRNPMVLEVKRHVTDELKSCKLAQAREQMLAAAMGDCRALGKLKSKLAAEPRSDPRLDELTRRLDEALARCRKAEELTRRLASVGNDCSALKALRKELGGRPKDGGPLNEPRARLESALAKCRAPLVAQAPKSAQPAKGADNPPAPEHKQAKHKQNKPVDTRKLCPGERPVELAPDLVIVFDASGSMSQPMSLGGELADALINGTGAIGAVIGGLARMQGGETRIDVAKKATNSIVGVLPDDVDVGLVLVEQCGQARPVGFFSPKQRKQLMSGVYAIQPVRGTPLASGIAKAAEMVDGVRSPATIVVISDGKESCNGNPCAVAAKIAKSKPMLTINVVDIMGTGAGTCAARATGGRVFAARNAAQLKSMLRSATAEVRGPANCRKK